VTNCRWQTVPHDWPGHRESSVTKFRPRTWNRVVGADRRAVPIACRIIVAVGVYWIYWLRRSSQKHTDIKKRDKSSEHKKTTPKDTYTADAANVFHTDFLIKDTELSNR